MQFIIGTHRNEDQASFLDADENIVAFFLVFVHPFHARHAWLKIVWVQNSRACRTFKGGLQGK